MPAENGNKWQQWIIGALSALTFLFFSLYISSVNADVLNVETNQRILQLAINDHAVQLEGIKEQHRMLENKLNQLLTDMRETRDTVIKGYGR